MSVNGDRGNGFDFLIDPYRFGGIPRSATSVPYPVVAEASIEGVVEGAFDTEMVALVEHVDSVHAVALTGTIRDILQAYSGGPEEIDSITAVAQSGLLAQILVASGAGPDSFDGVSAMAQGGELKRILIVILMETDSFNGVTAVALSGALQ